VTDILIIPNYFSVNSHNLRKISVVHPLKFFQPPPWFLSIHGASLACLVTQLWSLHYNTNNPKKLNYSKSCNVTLILLTWRIGWAPNNASKWQLGFSSMFEGLNHSPPTSAGINPYPANVENMVNS